MIRSTPPQVEKGALYNSTQAAGLLGVHRNHLLRYVKTGKIHPRLDKVTGRKVFEAAELTRFWNSRI